MKTYLEEKIGNPDLFTGRQKELTLFLRWIDGIKKKISMSTAILSRRKTGKTALLQRLYNLTFDANNGVIPFYYEVKERPVWMVDFCQDFFLTFLYQYVAFKTRNTLYLKPDIEKSCAHALDIVHQEHLEYLSQTITGVQQLVKEDRRDLLWSMVIDIPRGIAQSHDERVVQMIDEFQYLNSYIYRDQATTQLARDFAGGYMSTAEYKNAPLLIAGSWVGWLRDMLYMLLPGRFREFPFKDLPEDEAIEMIYKYSKILEIPVAEEVVYAMAQVSEGNPFYISALFQSSYLDKDFTTQEGLLKTLEFETLHENGGIRGVWAEYIAKIFDKVNQQNAKNIVLYLSKHRDRQIGRNELLEKLKLKMTDFELEQKMRAFVKSDVVNQGRSLFFYQGVQDNIFDKVFRGMYGDDIAAFDADTIANEYKALYEKAKADYHKLLGQFNQTKGLLAEFVIINQLRLHAFQQQDVFLSITHNLPKDFQFVEYEHVWSYKTARADKRDIWIDLFARAGKEQYSLIGEVKNRTTKPFSAAEAAEFVQKAQTLQEREQVEKAVLFVFSRHGFTQDALAYFQKHGIAYSDDECWLG